MNFFKRTLVALALIFGVFTLSSCNKQENEILFIKAGNPDGKISIGELNGNTYTNSYFGLSITFPENLYPLDNEQKLKMIEVDTKIINKGFDSDDLLKNVKDMIPLAVAYDKVEVLKNDNVASFVMMAQKIDDSNKDILSSASEYLRTMEKGFKEIVGFNLDYTLNILEPIIVNNPLT